MTTYMSRNTLGQDFIDGLAPTLLQILDQSENDYTLASSGAYGVENIQGTSLFKTEAVEGARLTVDGISQISGAKYTKEGENYNSDTRISTYRSEFDWKKFTQSLTVTEEMIRDKVAQARINDVRPLIIGTKREINQNMFDFYNYAFTPQATIKSSVPHLGFYGDGVPTCSTIHPIKGTGGVQSNASAGGIPLSETNLEIGRLALMNQRGDKEGELLSYGTGNIILLVPPQLQKLAIVLTKSEYVASSANNDINVYRGVMTVMSSQRLTSPTAWFLIDSMMHQVYHFVREPITVFPSFTNYENRNVTIQLKTSYLIGNKDWRGIWGSKGDGQAYAL